MCTYIINSLFEQYICVYIYIAYTYKRACTCRAVINSAL